MTTRIFTHTHIHTLSRSLNFSRHLSLSLVLSLSSCISRPPGPLALSLCIEDAHQSLNSALTEP
jgi:hypothetical protein